MAEVAEKSLRSVAGVSTAIAQTIERLLKAIADLNNSFIQTSEQRSLLSLLTDGNGYIQTIDSVENMDKYCELLRINKVPHLQTDSNHILFPESEIKKATELYKDLLIINNKKDIFMVDQKKLENAVLVNSSQLGSDEIVTTHKLSAIEQEILKYKCNDTEKSNIVGFNQDTDGKYSVSIGASNCLDLTKGEDDVYRDDFCMSTLQASVALYGANAEFNQKNIRADMTFDQNILYYVDGEHLDDNTLYIGSLDDKSKIIKVEAEGFQVFSCSMENGTLQMQSEGEFVSKANNPLYSVLLEVECNKLNNRELIFDKEILMQHLKIEGRVLESERPVLTGQEKRNEAFDSYLCSEIDAMIKDKIIEDGVSFITPLDSFKYYQTEASKILEAIADESKQTKVPGYDSEKIEFIQSYAGFYNVNLSDYQKAAKKTRETIEKTEVHKANPEKVKSYKKNKEKEKEGKEGR